LGGIIRESRIDYMNAQMQILLYVVLLFVVMYVMIIIPGKRKNKKMQDLHNSIKIGDEIITMGGIIATVKSRNDEILTVEIDPEKEICMKIVVYSVSNIRKRA